MRDGAGQLDDAARSRSSIRPTITCSFRGGRLDRLWLSRTENSSPAMSLPPPDSRMAQGSSLPRDLLELAGQLVQLARVVGHLFDGVALVGHGLDRVVERPLRAPRAHRRRIVEPGVPFGEEQPGALARAGAKTRRPPAPRGHGLPRVEHGLGLVLALPERGRPPTRCDGGSPAARGTGWSLLHGRALRHARALPLVQLGPNPESAADRRDGAWEARPRSQGDEADQTLVTL